MLHRRTFLEILALAAAPTRPDGGPNAGLDGGAWSSPNQAPPAASAAALQASWRKPTKPTKVILSVLSANDEGRLQRGRTVSMLCSPPPSNHVTQGEICHQDGAIVAMTRRDDIHTHDIAFDRSDFDPVEHRVNDVTSVEDVEWSAPDNIITARECPGRYGTRRKVLLRGWWHRCFYLAFPTFKRRRNFRRAHGAKTPVARSATQLKRRDQHVSAPKKRKKRRSPKNDPSNRRRQSTKIGPIWRELAMKYGKEVKPHNRT
jgi:hypothetical protein